MSIAVAHSDTAEGRAALLCAAEEAAVRRTGLLVLHVADGDTAPADGRQVQQIESSVRSTLREHGAPDVEWAVRTAAGGHDVAGALVDLVVETGAELVVMGSKRRSPIGKLLLGSTVQRVVLDAPVPVLVVKARQP